MVVEAEGGVEVARGLVPVQDREVEAGAACALQLSGQVQDQGPADPAPARAGADVELLEVDPALALPGAVVGEVERHSQDPLGGLGFAGEVHREQGPLSEAVSQEVLAGRQDGLGLALELGQLVDQGQDRVDVLGSGPANRDAHALGSRSS